MAELTTPDIRNYTVGKGIVSFKKTGEGSFRDLGNVTQFEFTPTVEKLDHFSSRNGIKKKDRSVTLSTEGELKITMDEWVTKNLQMVLLANIDTNSDGQEVLDILQLAEISGVIKFTGTNIVGPKFEWIFNNVSFTPSSSISPLSDEWGEFETTGQILADVDGKFGTVTRIGGEEDDDSSS